MAIALLSPMNPFAADKPAGLSRPASATGSGFAEVMQRETARRGAVPMPQGPAAPVADIDAPASNDSDRLADDAAAAAPFDPAAAATDAAAAPPPLAPAVAPAPALPPVASAPTAPLPAIAARAAAGIAAGTATPRPIDAPGRSDAEPDPVLETGQVGADRPDPAISQAAGGSAPAAASATSRRAGFAGLAQRAGLDSGAAIAPGRSGARSAVNKDDTVSDDGDSALRPLKSAASVDDRPEGSTAPAMVSAWVAAIEPVPVPTASPVAGTSTLAVSAHTLAATGHSAATPAVARSLSAVAGGPAATAGTAAGDGDGEFAAANADARADARADASPRAGRQPTAPRQSDAAPGVAVQRRLADTDEPGAQPAAPRQAPAVAAWAGAADQAGAGAAAGPAQAGAAAAPAAPTGPPAAAATRALMEAHVEVAVDHPSFGSALGAQVSVFARDGVQQARLQLHPADMGPISVQIAIEGSAARVHFQAELAATRDLIEAALPALAGALRESGLTLTGGGVSQQSPGRQQQPDGQDPSRAQSRQPGGHALDGPPREAVRTRTTGRGLVDLVA